MFSSTSNFSDTGVAPRGILINGHALHAHVASPLAQTKKKEAGMTNGASDDQGQPGIGHSSKIAESACYTPSKLSFEEAAALSAGPARNVHRLRVLQAAIFDPRLGDCPLPVKLLAAVLEHVNRETGVAYPGTKTLAEEIYQDLQKLPPEERVYALDKAANVIMKTFTLLKQCGYDVSTRRAPPGGGRAITHHALTYPDPDELQAVLPIHRRWRDQDNARGGSTRRKSDQADLTGTVRLDILNVPVRSETGSDLTAPVRSAASDLTGKRVLTLPANAKIDPPLFITEPSNNLHAGADAPGGEDAGATEKPSRDTKSARSSSKRATPAAAPPMDAVAAFEKFWDVFPPGRKRDKADTRDLFVAIVTGKHKNRRASAEVVVAAAERYAATRPDPQYTPMPSTWLNGGRWEDDECQPKSQAVRADEEVELAATLARMRAEEGWQ